MQRRVIIESPFAGKGETYAERQADAERKLRYLRACLRDSLLRDEAPFASHALYTQEGVLDDTMPTERAMGIDAGFAWRHVADATIVYNDLGITQGMEMGIHAAHVAGHPIEFRQLRGEWSVAPEPAPAQLVELEVIAAMIMGSRSKREAIEHFTGRLHVKYRDEVLDLIRKSLATIPQGFSEEIYRSFNEDDDRPFRFLEKYLPEPPRDDQDVDAGGERSLSTGEPAPESETKFVATIPCTCMECLRVIGTGDEYYVNEKIETIMCVKCHDEHPRSGNYDAGSVGESVPPGVGEGNKRRGLPGT